jgi:hypothetical protein
MSEKSGVEQFIKKFNFPESARLEDFPIKELDSAAERRFVKKCKKGIDKLPHKSIVAFDFDGTILSNQNGRDHYIRRGFSEIYKYSREKRFYTGICTMRSMECIPELKGFEMDFAVGVDKMADFLNSSPLMFAPHSLIKIEFLNYWFETYSNFTLLLIDDDHAVGKVGKRLGYVVHIPHTKEFAYDF